MAPQILLVTPLSADPDTLSTALAGLLEGHQVAALIVRRGERDDRTYRTLLETVLEPAQRAGCAVLVDDDIDLALAIGADGVHVSGGVKAVSTAVERLRPHDLIVGAGPAWTRHAAMTLGEAGIDYLYFGALGEVASEEVRDMAAWWAETFEVPAVLAAQPGQDAAGCEFLGLGEALWTYAGGPRSGLAVAIAGAGQ